MKPTCISPPISTGVVIVEAKINENIAYGLKNGKKIWN
jgi:hypothetical protein